MTTLATASSLAQALTAEALDASGTGYFTVHTHANQHVGYFPGAKPVHILMHVGADGQILGVQAVGTDGVDRRIDVVATAMRGRPGPRMTSLTWTSPTRRPTGRPRTPSTRPAWSPTTC